MPHLVKLRLERGSTLASFRDLGSSLVNLRVLWLSACGVCHLDGVGALAGLEELYLAFNDVEDLTSIALHDRLEVGQNKSAILAVSAILIWSRAFPPRCRYGSIMVCKECCVNLMGGPVEYVQNDGM